MKSMRMLKNFLCCYGTKIRLPRSELEKRLEIVREG